jgi:hypothetical protein
LEYTHWSAYSGILSPEYTLLNIYSVMHTLEYLLRYVYSGVDMGCGERVMLVAACEGGVLRACVDIVKSCMSGYSYKLKVGERANQCEPGYMLMYLINASVWKM